MKCKPGKDKKQEKQKDKDLARKAGRRSMGDRGETDRQGRWPSSDDSVRIGYQF